jgi:AbrB family looped-hinge helix DNA binding protein
MTETTITDKGQVTIPKSLRDKLNLNSGDKLEWTEEDGKLILRKVRSKEKLMKSCGIVQMSDTEYDKVMKEIRPPLE